MLVLKKMTMAREMLQINIEIPHKPFVFKKTVEIFETCAKMQLSKLIGVFARTCLREI
jgi:hypothetical protein